MSNFDTNFEKSTAQRAMEMVMQGGAQAARITLNFGIQNSFSAHNGEIENLQNANDRNLYIQIISNDRYGAYSTNRLNERELQSFIKQAIETTSYLTPDKYRALPPKEICWKGEKSVDLQQYDPYIMEMEPQEKRRIALEVMEEVYDAAKEKTAENKNYKLISVSTEYGDMLEYQYMIDSQGFEGDSLQSNFTVSAECSIKGKKSRKKHIAPGGKESEVNSIAGTTSSRSCEASCTARAAGSRGCEASCTAGAADSRSCEASYKAGTTSSRGCEVSCTAGAAGSSGEMNARCEGWWYESALHYKNFNYKGCGQTALSRAISKLNPREIKGGKLNMVVENSCSSRLVSPIFSALNGNNIQQRNSFLMEKLGQQVFSSKLTIKDNPHWVGMSGSRYFDGEGIATKPIEIISNGVIKNYFINSYAANKMGVSPTVESPSVPHFLPDEFPQQERNLSGGDMIKILQKGVLVTGFNGGNCNGLTGDFSYGIEGFYFENGEILFPVKEMNISGNIISLWNDLALVGNDARTCSRWLIPSLAFINVDFTGI